MEEAEDQMVTTPTILVEVSVSLTCGVGGVPTTYLPRSCKVEEKEREKKVDGELATPSDTTAPVLHCPLTTTSRPQWTPVSPGPLLWATCHGDTLIDNMVSPSQWRSVTSLPHSTVHVTVSPSPPHTTLHVTVSPSLLPTPYVSLSLSLSQLGPST